MTSTTAAEAAARRLLLTLALVAAVLVAIVWAVFRPENLRSAAPEPTVPPPSETAPAQTDPSPSPEPGPGAWELPPRYWEPLTMPETATPDWYPLGGNTINDAPAVVLDDCPAPATVASLAEYQRLVTQQWDCLHAAFVPMFEAMGASTVRPALVFYTGIGSRSECGWIEAPAFYCSAGEGTGYFGTEHFEMTKTWDLAINEMVNHEYGHHVQKTVGITAAKLRVANGEDVERRAELQAICWSGMLTIHSENVRFSQPEFEGWIARVDAMVSSDVHGTRQSLEYWGMRGLWAEGFGDCNTWVADDELVA